MKALASLRETHGTAFRATMEEINAFAGRYDLRQFTTWSKIWEYPWLERRARDWVRPGARILDLGSENSPMPWRWASAGARVTMVEVNDTNVSLWSGLRERFTSEGLLGESGGDVDWRIVPDERLPFEDGAFSLITSFSVIEHMPDKGRAVDEAARVLRAGGKLAISFDICEPESGMTFPEWNGRALTMREFDELVWRHPLLTPLDPLATWNTDDIADFLAWHRTTAAHHNYVVGAAVMVRR